MYIQFHSSRITIIFSILVLQKNLNILADFKSAAISNDPDMLQKCFNSSEIFKSKNVIFMVYSEIVRIPYYSSFCVYNYIPDINIQSRWSRLSRYKLTNHVRQVELIRPCRKKPAVFNFKFSVIWRIFCFGKCDVYEILLVPRKGIFAYCHPSIQMYVVHCTYSTNFSVTCKHDWKCWLIEKCDKGGFGSRMPYPGIMWIDSALIYIRV